MISPAFIQCGSRPRRGFLRPVIVGAALLALALGSSLGCSRQPKSEAKAEAGALRTASERPNILVYVSDTLRADALGCYGNEVVATPTLDRLAAQGVLFEQAIAPSSWTRASMASILTGLYPSAHKADGRMSVLPDVPRISKFLQKHGYQTGNFTTNPNTAAVFGFKPGFDHLDEFGKHRRANRVRVSELTVPSEELHESIATWVSELDPKEPFFVFALSIDPHAPYTPSAEFDRYGDPDYRGPIDTGADEKMLNQQQLTPADRARVRSLYHGDVTHNDHTLGVLLDRLKELGRADNTIVVFTADHGEELWEHGQRGHGKSLFGEVLHIPLIWYDPQNPRAGQRIARQVTTIDIMPSILERLQIKGPACLQGISLFDESAGDRAIFSELNLDTHQLAAVYQHPWKLILNQERGRTYLFNTESDAVERKNLAKAEPEVCARLRSLLENHLRTSPSLCKDQADGRVTLDESQVPEDMRKNLGDIGYAGWDDEEDSADQAADPANENSDSPAVDDHDAVIDSDDGVEDVPAGNAGAGDSGSAAPDHGDGPRGSEDE